MLHDYGATLSKLIFQGPCVGGSSQVSMLVRTGYTFSAYFSYKFSTLIMQSIPPSSNIKANVIYSVHVVS